VRLKKRDASQVKVKLRLSFIFGNLYPKGETNSSNSLLLLHFLP
jgi:hypothetical protein